VLVTSFRPLKAYIYKMGFCRFCTVRYNQSTNDLDNLFVHLTNVSIQKNADDYNSQHGGKWTLESLRLYLSSTMGNSITDKLFDDINWLIIHNLKSVTWIMNSDRHCFEIYGFDVIIDDNLKPWLIEVNASPSLSSTTSNDRIMKYSVIRDSLSILLHSGDFPDAKADKTPPRSAFGQYELLYDEEIDKQSQEQESKKSKPVTGRPARPRFGGRPPPHSWK